MKDVKGAGASRVGDVDDFLGHATPGRDGPSASRADGRAYGGFEPVEVRSSDWENFTYQPTSAAPPVSIAPTERPLTETVSRGGLPRGIKGSGDADHQIDEALFGLSQPARPRNTNPAETQSFAPARDSEFELEPRQAITLDDFDELISSELAAMRGSGAPPQQDDDYALGYEDADDQLEPYEYDDYPVRTRSRLKSIALMGGVAVIAIVAVAGAAVTLLPGSERGDDSFLITADTEPFKIAPADPGGRSIPNQNKAVYQKVAGVSSQTPPTQQSLETAMEEPLDIAADEDVPPESLPGVDMGEEIALPDEEPAATPAAEPTRTASADDGTLQPRKVRTMTVRPDGTLVASEAPASSLLSASSMQAHAATLDPIAGIQPTMPFGDSADITTASTTPAPVEAPAAPQPMPVPEAPRQVAAIAEQPAPADAYFVQIASQPSQAAAEESMANMGRRFSSVIGGRSLGIKSAEIPGKGTFYRVRVTAASKNEANSLCESLKSAGGSCFVTR
ncbi:SPOR domain-containing protein [Aureimonas sp. ME7]|uniref:SPOR domain-containing protein n=1 Tax=Aureimonas sp. ME7 TaxID=2744252 RepID=UPI0015F3BAA3|nr:SPOR domain-containing protein [Aureimonas sp. ME7]